MGQALPEAFAEWDYLSRAQYLESLLFLSGYLLSSQGDRVSMAHAVEIRPPYLDHRIIELLGKVPHHLKIAVLNEKHLLKEALRGIVPEEILSRPKHPYRAPISRSLLSGRNGPSESLLEDRSLKESMLFEPSKVKRLLQKIRSAHHVSEVDEMALAGILSTQILHEKFIASSPHDTIQPVHPGLLFDRRR